ncbi:MAG: hypothetical protein IPF78_11340 [Flavobacteriales bacterium]|nr:hypothetical protein [Flavobacteriales bacterium]
MKPDDLSYILNHLGEDREAGYNAVVPPIAQSGNFTYPTVEACATPCALSSTCPVHAGREPHGRHRAEEAGSAEHAEDALLFSSGSASIAAGVVAS